MQLFFCKDYRVLEFAIFAIMLMNVSKQLFIYLGLHSTNTISHDLYKVQFEQLWQWPDGPHWIVPLAEQNGAHWNVAL